MAKQSASPLTLAGLMLTLMTVCPPVLAEVELSMSAVREKTAIGTDGSLMVRREPVRLLKSGDTLEITIHYVNSGDDAVENVKIDNPIPAGTLYQPGSAAGTDTDKLVSMDGGETWQPPGTDDHGITNLRWVIPRLAAKGTGDVTFRLIAIRGDVQLP